MERMEELSTWSIARRRQPHDSPAEIWTRCEAATGWMGMPDRAILSVTSCEELGLAIRSRTKRVMAEAGRARVLCGETPCHTMLLVLQRTLLALSCRECQTTKRMRPRADPAAKSLQVESRTLALECWTRFRAAGRPGSASCSSAWSGRGRTTFGRKGSA
jgi:hypothetical protein